MSWSPKLQRQSSCTCTPLDFVGGWPSNSSRRRLGYFNNGYDYEEPENIRYDGIISRWRGIWRKIVKEKRRIVVSLAPVQLQYDPYSYGQNFDDGEIAAEEPENLSRSFSVRFAAPTRMLQRFK